MISVVIPLYNKAQSIRSTIESVLNQTYTDFEIVVVDDGSTDNSANVVGDIKNDRIRLIRKENGGVCSARNSGILEAKYDYIALLDADDCWDKEYLSEQLKLIKDFPDAAMWGINFAEMYDGKLIRELPTGLPKSFRGIVDGYFDKTLKNGRISDLFCSSSVVIRKSVFDTAGMFDERIKYAEDTDMWWRIIARNPVAFYDRYMAFYQYDAENRALNKYYNLQISLEYYIDKYSSYSDCTTFYEFANRWSAVRLRKYFFGSNIKDRKAASTAIKKLDYNVIPYKYRLFFKTPYFLGSLFNKLDDMRRGKQC